MIIIILTGLAMLELTTAQVFSYIPRNVIGPANIQGGQNINLNNLRTLPNNGITLSRGMPNTAELNYNQVANIERANLNAQRTNQVVTNQLANAQIANSHLANTQLTNNQIASAQLANNQIANAQLANNQITNAQIAQNAQIAALQNQNANRQYATQRIAATNELANLANANVEAIAINNLANIENKVAAGNLAEVTPFFVNGNQNIAALASSLASINGNMATFNIGNGGAFTVTSGSPNSPAFGIQVLADALEVGGTVAVNGQIPIFGTVAVNGNLPTDGTAAVSYSCGRSVNV
ncbi:unnamed protein product [Leptidea sinapis]|uniref:Uncharacterized protein n=1 Tax=Leptidea sinapis TaxID=189913 RepID=A0A5E4Q1W5_9NEOP|nr:unnamed protein product [Leptidea sinapis]